MPPVIWNDQAEAGLRDVVGYIAARNPDAADRFLDLIREAAERLGEHPDLYRPGRVPGTRECVVHPNYILVFREAPDAIHVVSLLHARQQYP